MSLTQDLFDAMQSHALATGLFDQVNTYEEKSGPGDGTMCGIWINRIVPIPEASGLDSTTSQVEFTNQIYHNAFGDPLGAIDPNVTHASIELMDAYSGDFDLGITQVRNVNLLGEYGFEPLQAQSGYIEIDNQISRVMVITVPIIVNDLFAHVA